MQTASNRTILKIAIMAGALASLALVFSSHARLHRWRLQGSDSDDPQAQMALARSLYNQRRLPEAQQAFERAAQLAPEDARPCNWLTTLALESNRPDLALHSIDESLKRNPHDYTVWRTAGDLFLKQGDRHSALKSYRQATTVNAKDAASWKCLGILEAEIDPAAGIRDLQQAAALSPDDFDTQLAMGQAALTAGNTLIAERALRKALALRPTDSAALLASARLLMTSDLSAETLKRAGEQIDAAIQSNPSPMAYQLRGRQRLLDRRYPAAIADLNEAIRRDPTLPSAHAYLSQAFAATHRAGLARKEADTFARLTGRQRTVTAGSDHP